MKLFQKFKSLIQNQLSLSNVYSNQMLERQIVLQGLILSRSNREIKKLNSLKDVEFSAFSQWGEDGIIDWLINQIPEIQQTFIEFGVADYRESNTRFLLQKENWKGLILDGSEANIADIKKQDIHWRHNLQVQCAFIEPKNINALIKTADFSGELGLLSVDIDGNDFWVWDAINCIEPAIVVCEYNGNLGDKHSLSIPYKEKFDRSNAHYSLLYFGASLNAMIALGEKKGYKFIGTESNGCNAFFVKNKYFNALKNKIGTIKSYPLKAREARDKDGVLSYISAPERTELIADMPILKMENLKTSEHELVEIGSLKSIYSSEWAQGIGRDF